MTLIRTREKLGEHNRRQVLSEILLNGPLPRTSIATRVGLTNASVSRITRDLIDGGLVEEADSYAGSSGRGRHFVALRVRPEGGYIAGIAVNAFRQDVVIADIGNRPIVQRRLALDNLDDPDVVLTHCAEQLREAIAETGIDGDAILGCGVTITGAVDPERGSMRSAPAIGWREVNIASLLSPILDMPLVIDSIPNAKHLAAHFFGPAKNSSNTLLINASLGIGASLLLDGHLIRGHRASAGLLQSMLIPDDHSGELHAADQVAGGYGAISFSGRSRSADGQATARTLGTLIQQADAKDQDTRRALHRAGRNLGWIAAQSCALLHPEKALVSGPMIASKDYCDGLIQSVATLSGGEPNHLALDFYPIDSIEAAQSLAIYHFLVKVTPDYPQLPAAGGF